MYSDIKNFKKVFAKKGKCSGIYRLKLMKKPLNKLSNTLDAINILKLHNRLDKNTNNKKHSICMHGEYSTTGSMVVELDNKRSPKIYFTAKAHPCQSLFLPFEFNDKIINPINSENECDTSFWEKYNKEIELNEAQHCKLDEMQKSIIIENYSLELSLKHMREIYKQMFSNKK